MDAAAFCARLHLRAHACPRALECFLAAGGLAASAAIDRSSRRLIIEQNLQLSARRSAGSAQTNSPGRQQRATHILTPWQPARLAPLAVPSACCGNAETACRQRARDVTFRCPSAYPAFRRLDLPAEPRPRGRRTRPARMRKPGTRYRRRAGARVSPGTDTTARSRAWADRPLARTGPPEPVARRNPGAACRGGLFVAAPDADPAVPHGSGASPPRRGRSGR